MSITVALLMGYCKVVIINLKKPKNLFEKRSTKMLPTLKESQELQMSLAQAADDIEASSSVTGGQQTGNDNDNDYVMGQDNTMLVDTGSLPFQTAPAPAPAGIAPAHRDIENSGPVRKEESKEEIEIESEPPMRMTLPIPQPPQVEEGLKGSNKMIDGSSSSSDGSEKEGPLNSQINDDMDGNLSSSEKDDDESRDSAESLEAAIRNRVIHVLLWKLMEKAFNGCMREICEWLHKLYKWVKRCCKHHGGEDDAQTAVDSVEKTARCVLLKNRFRSGSIYK